MFVFWPFKLPSCPGGPERRDDCLKIKKIRTEGIGRLRRKSRLEREYPVEELQREELVASDHVGITHLIYPKQRREQGEA
ncbi:hypothetical protein N7493_010548 [Penicillium malachiteum]|uniref:Uncharacterized protein n=1 Tax=Penicillium malachiteum TaxID=1324776 RepID=A0AAD6HDC0_9EURO|nr:hypothetical protein N7493_010548 [Penicillium malachiteum]